MTFHVSSAIEELKPFAAKLAYNGITLKKNAAFRHDNRRDLERLNAVTQM